MILIIDIDIGNHMKLDWLFLMLKLMMSIIFDNDIPENIPRCYGKVDWLFRVENSQWYQSIALISALQRIWLVGSDMGD
jgi:hypothetical protein